MSFPAPTHAPVRVLLIEDDEIDRTAITREIARTALPYRLTHVDSIAEARRVLADAEFDILLADYRLPDGTVFDLLEAFPDQSVILLTALGSEEVAAKGFRAGIRDYLIKDHDSAYLKLLPWRVDAVLRQDALTRELRESESRFRTLIERSPEGILVHREGVVTFANAAAVSLFRAGSVDHLVGGKMLDLIDPEFQPLAQERAAKVASTEKSVPLVEMTFLALDGGKIRAEVQTTAMTLNGQPALQSTLRDVTERRLIEEDLRRSNARWRTLFSLLPVGVSVVRPDEGVIDHNPALESILDLSTDEIQRASYQSRPVVSEDGRPMAPEDSPAARAVRGKRVIQGVTLGTVKPDGTTVWTEVSAAPLDSPEGDCVIVAIDVSARRQAEKERASLEAQLRQSQKVEALGILSAGIAHDFNNLLATILGNVDLARGAPALDPLIEESLEEIEKAGMHGQDVVQQILSFSRQQAPDMRPIQVAEVVTAMGKMLRATLPGRIAFGVDCGSDPIWALADGNQLQQVLVNLTTNAMQAIGSGEGRIRIHVGAVTLEESLTRSNPSLARLALVNGGRAVRISVADTGPGMDKATMDRIFDPFFTTKGPGEGTGLGLSVVSGIVFKHDGAIVVDSEPGRGSTFDIYLRVAEPPGNRAEIKSGGPAQATADETRGLRIMYVDDNESLLKAIVSLLKLRGHDAAGYADPTQALAAFEADPHGVDVLVTDQHMPEVSGLELAQEARKIRPDLKVALVSGYADDLLRRQASTAGIRDIIAKGSVQSLVERLGQLASE